VGQPHRADDRRPARVLRGARLLEDRVSVAQRSLLVNRSGGSARARHALNAAKHDVAVLAPPSWCSRVVPAEGVDRDDAPHAATSSSSSAALAVAARADSSTWAPSRSPRPRRSRAPAVPGRRRGRPPRVGRGPPPPSPPTAAAPACSSWATSRASTEPPSRELRAELEPSVAAAIAADPLQRLPSSRGQPPGPRPPPPPQAPRPRSPTSRSCRRARRRGCRRPRRAAATLRGHGASPRGRDHGAVRDVHQRAFGDHGPQGGLRYRPAIRGLGRREARSSLQITPVGYL
jgi:hypothetical protein